MASSVFLPKTDFPMRQRVSDDEIIAKWEGLYAKLRQQSKDLPKFILQDGPPFANGKPHMGTAFNRVLKDIIIRYKQMSGYDAPFIPGWDCHGLPIEWKVEEQIRAEREKGDEKYDHKALKSVDEIIAFRARCREFAQYWIGVQKDGFKKLGTIANWEDPYLTMTPYSESKIVSCIFELLSKDVIYSGYKPVMWSPVEQTALSDAEIEYKDKVSKSVYIAFSVKSPSLPILDKAEVVIWTTTPWTIPANRAICYGDAIQYSLIQLGSRRLLAASDRLTEFAKDCEIEGYSVLAEVSGSDLAGTVCKHPFNGLGYDFDVPMLAGEHVTTDAGTGFVHTAPGHGLEDFAVCKANGISVPLVVNGDGTYVASVPLFAGIHVYKADVPVIAKLLEVGALLSQKEIVHSYPHSWRSKCPLIFNTTKQWFIDLDKSGIRKNAIDEINKVEWLPARGKNRIRSFVEGRKEWCISRQRLWGIPLPFFMNKQTHKVLIDKEIFSNIINIIEKEGSDAWYIRPSEDFLKGKYNADDYEKIFDIVDVWLESGSVFAYVTLSRPELAFPADLYLEGSDQHRGWFQSSLLTSVGTCGIAPYKSVLTHGFIVDESGYKMSKSLGNVIDPLEVIKKYGVDVLRLCVANSDYTEDMRIGPNILDQQKDLSRKFRNVIRYLLGALNGFSVEESIDYNKMDILEKWALARLQQVSVRIQEAMKEFNLRSLINELKIFCFTDLSSFYFDVRKDCLYCDGKGSFKRRGYRTVLHHICNRLLRWLAPIMAIATEEAWSKISSTSSIHAQNLLPVPEAYANQELLDKFKRVFEIRDALNTALERARENKIIGANLQAKVSVYSNTDLVLDESYWEELCIVSAVHISSKPIGSEALTINGVSIKVEKFDGLKCDRCWKFFDKLNEDNMCTRCAMYG